MVFWSRLRQSKFKFNLLMNEFKGCYSLNQGAIFANRHIPSRTLIPALNNPNFVAKGSQFEFFCKVRFYAAPLQANQKKEERDTSGPRLNEQITAPSLRLVTDEGHFVVSRYEALARAKSLKMDLVEVDRHAKPPVCKILDYHKEKYLQQTREKERAKSKATLKKGSPKEVRFAAKIKQNDLQIKADMVKRLMESGHRVKCTAIEPSDDLDLETLLSRFCALIEDVAIEESPLKVEKKQAFVVVRHIKFGPSKKGSGKKASKAAVSSQTGSQSTGNQPLEDTASSETEHVDSEELSDEDIQTNKSEWAVFDRDDDIHAVFDINNEEDGLLKSKKHKQSATISEPSPYSVDRNAASSIPPGLPKQAMENRYARDPRSEKPSRLPTDMNGRGPRNTTNSVPHIPGQARQPPYSVNTSSQMRPSRQVEVPTYEVSKQDSSRSSIPTSPTESYGIFSKQQVNTTPREQSPPAETNRYKKNGPSDPHRNPPPRDSRISRGPGTDNPGRGRWGVFSTDNSNMIPNKKNESQAEIQRR